MLRRQGITTLSQAHKCSIAPFYLHGIAPPRYTLMIVMHWRGAVEAEHSSLHRPKSTTTAGTFPTIFTPLYIHLTTPHVLVSSYPQPPHPPPLRRKPLNSQTPRSSRHPHLRAPKQITSLRLFRGRRQRAGFDMALWLL